MHKLDNLCSFHKMDNCELGTGNVARMEVNCLSKIALFEVLSNEPGECYERYKDTLDKVLTACEIDHWYPRLMTDYIGGQPLLKGTSHFLRIAIVPKWRKRDSTTIQPITSQIFHCSRSCESHRSLISPNQRTH